MTPAVTPDFFPAEEKHPDFIPAPKATPAPMPKPNPMGLANQELRKSGLEVGVPKLSLPKPEFTGGRVARALTAAGATMGPPKPYDPNRSMIAQQMENLNAQNPENAKRTISGIAERAGEGDVPGALGEAGGIAAQVEIGRRAMARGGAPGLEMQAPLTAKPMIPYERASVGINRAGRAIERNAPTIGKVVGVGAGVVGIGESALHGSPTGVALSALGIPRMTKFGTVAARGTGRAIASLGHPEAPFAPETGPMRTEPAATSPTQDVIAANPGEMARRLAIGTRPTEPLILPRTNRGLMLPDRGATVAPKEEIIPPRQRIDALAKEAVKGAGGSPETPAPLERGKPIYQRKLGEARIPAEPPLTKTEGSSALNGYHYDPATQTMTIGLKSGSQYRYGEVTPEEFQNFEAAASKGKAYQDIKNNHVQTAVNYGKGWNATKPAKALHSSETVPDVDLAPALEKSIRMARAAKAK